MYKLYLGSYLLCSLTSSRSLSIQEMLDFFQICPIDLDEVANSKLGWDDWNWDDLRMEVGING